MKATSGSVVSLSNKNAINYPEIVYGLSKKCSFKKNN